MTFAQKRKWAAAGILTVLEWKILKAHFNKTSRFDLIKILADRAFYECQFVYQKNLFA